MGVVRHPPFQPMTDDKDDYRPNSSYILIGDNAPEGARVENLVTILERLAPGDRVPLHVHPIAELITFYKGSVELILGTERQELSAPASVFVPPGTTHGYLNLGDEVVELQGVFPSSTIEIEYIERNPAPGTEGDSPGAYLYGVATETITEVPRRFGGAVGSSP